METNNSCFKEEAIPFIIFNPATNLFELTSEASEFLKQVPGPLGLVAVAGMYRTGKSYLLNRMLLDRSNGFGVGPSINPCTKGLWIWGRPVRGVTPEGEAINVLIVDTEGLGALDEDSNHDVRIFSLAILLSSYFLYNSVGSIDESALSNLSLVINLTKHIHIRSKGSNEDLDTEEYGTYFPSFMWVVRDFTLQLVNEDGDELTPKEYFEKALSEQKGMSDNVESKNRIRKLLKSFFKERDCQTLIRPLTNEENLQNLVTMDLSDLRSEFQEQVLVLRRKVLHRVKPKMLNGKKLNGSMMVTLAQSYVQSINNGVVPNIENAWNYICKSECGKAVEESLQKFEEILKDNIMPRIPMDEEDLKEAYRESKKDALNMFVKKAVGSGVQEEYLKELKEKMNSIYLQIKEENERQAAQQSQIFLANSYTYIERKLKNKEFAGGFIEFEQDMKAFEHYFMENGPNGPFKRMFLLEFVQQATLEAADFFNRNTQNELELQKQISQDHYKNLEAHIKELKQDYSRDKEKFDQKLRSVEVEKAELSALEQSLRENLERLQSEKVSVETELSQKLEMLTREKNRELEELRNRMSNTENLNSEMQRKVYAAGSEFEKDKALLEQKIEFLERNIQDFQKKENDYSQEIKLQKKEHQSLVRDMQSKYEQQLRSANVRLEEQTEKLLDIQSQLDELEQKYGYEKQQWEDSQESLKNNANVSQSQYVEMQRTIEDLKNKRKQETDKLTFELQDLRDSWRFKEDDLEGQVREKDEELKLMQTKFQKELAIFQQKLEFKEVQSQQLRSQLDETKKSHENMIRAIENKTRESLDGREQVQKQVEQLRQIHEAELKKATKESADEIKRLEQQVEQLCSRNSELEMDLKLHKQESEKELNLLRSQIELSEQMRDKALSQSKLSDNQRLKLLEEAEERHTGQIQALERELEDEKYRAETEIKEVQTKSEESLAQLKSFYEIEKKRLENRLQEEKERELKKLTALQDEFDSRIRYEQTQHEEDVEMLQEELQEKEHRFQSQLNQLEHELSLAHQKIETLENHMKEKEERYSKEQTMSVTQMDAQFERFNTERKELIAKIEGFNALVGQKDREITLLKTKFDSTSEDLDKKKRIQDELKQEFQQEKTKLQEKIDLLRQKNQELSDEFIQKKLEDAREIALYNQQMEFHSKKIEDLQKQNEELISKYEDRITTQKNDFQQEIQDLHAKMNLQKEQLESKHEQKRRHYKDQESQLHKQFSDIQKEKAVLEEKTFHLEQKRKEVRQKYEQEIAMLRDQLGNSSENLAKEREILLHDNERLKNQLQEMEREFSDVQSSYERDKALWDGKFTFLEQQKELAKSDLQEATRKFEMTLEQLQKRGYAEKDKFEMSQNTLIFSIEQKYKQQIKEQIDNNQKTINDLNEKNKNLEKENRQLQNRLQLEHRDKMSDHGSMEKKVGELLETETRLQKELEELKQERDKRVMDHQRNLDKEREVYKARLQESEQKYKELESRRSSMIFEVEKDRAKWGLERDHLVSQKSEVQEQLDRIQRRYEILVRENEKLKNDRNQRKMYNPTSGTGAIGQGAGGYGSKLTPSMFGQTLMKGLASKENAISSSQAFPSGFSKYISDGNASDKADPHSLPLSVKDTQAKIGSSISGLMRPGSRDSNQNLLNVIAETRVGTKFNTGSVGSSSTDESHENK